jgi:hypothetical protein
MGRHGRDQPGIALRHSLRKAAKGANSDITSLSGLTTALSVAQGGTGSTTSAGALSNLGGLPVAGASGLKSRYRFNASGGSVGIIFDDTGLSGYGSFLMTGIKRRLHSTVTSMVTVSSQYTLYTGMFIQV